MNRLDEQYQTLLQDIIEFGVEKKDRTGTGTKSIFGYTIHHNMRNGFPLLTTKKVAFKTMATELMWFLMGDTNIKYLVNNGCNIWNGDAYKRYVNAAKNDGYYLDEGVFSMEEFINKIKTEDEFANNWGELGPIYGKQWRKWESDDTDAPRYEHWKKDIDQIQNLINDLKTDPDSRRLMVSAWNVGELDQMVLPPCHYGFQVYTRELSLKERTAIFHNSPHSEHDNLIKFKDINELNKVIPKRAISLIWNQRSVDVFLGLPFNIASYGLLLEMIAREVNMVPEHLIGHLGDTHLYLNHIE